MVLKSVGVLFVTGLLLWGYFLSPWLPRTANELGDQAAQRLQAVTGIEAEKFGAPKYYVQYALHGGLRLHGFVASPEVRDQVCQKLRMERADNALIPPHMPPQWWRKAASQFRQPTIYFRDRHGDWEMWVLPETNECFLCDTRGG